MSQQSMARVPGFELVEGLAGLSEGVGDGLVPVLAAPRARSSRALPAQSFRHDQAERSENR